MTSRHAVVALGLVVAGLTPVASQRQSQRPAGATQARADAAAPFKIGETLTYDVSWSMFLVAGTAVTTVVEKEPLAKPSSASAYTIVAEGRPVPLVAKLYPFYYRMDTLLDSYTLLSHRGTFYSQEGAERRTATTTFDRAGQRVQFDVSSGTTETRRYPVPTATEDGLAAFYLVRARGVNAGERFSIPIADSGTLFTAEFTVGGLESVKVPYGTLSAWNIRVSLTDSNGQAFWKNTNLWMSNDARRLPLKMQAELPVGHFVLALKDVR